MFIINYVLAWFVSTNLWKWLSRNFIAKLGFRLFGYPKFKMCEYFKIREIVKSDPNKIYAFAGADTCSCTWVLNHLVTKCKYGHAGIVRLEEGELYIYHMIGEGMMRWCLIDYLREVDRFMLCELPIAEENIKKANSRIDQIINSKDMVEYDFKFDLSRDLPDLLDTLDSEFKKLMTKVFLYCSEFVFVVGSGLVTDKDFKEVWRSGRFMFEPDSLISSTIIRYSYLNK